jgi:hypothetical protein
MNAHAMKTTLARVVLLGGFALALSGCYETAGGDCTQPFADLIRG